MTHTKPFLPPGLQAFQLLYSLAVRSVNLWTSDKRREIVEAVEEAAAIELGELKGKIWQATYAEHIADLERLQQDYIDSPLPLVHPTEVDPFGSLKDKIEYKKWAEENREKDF